ncbi:MAG: O-methyltransferase [Anaerovoracaceae bacterium]
MNITNDIVTDYINSFYKAKNVQLDRFRRESEDKNVPIILRETENFLNVLLEVRKPKKILEIGTAVGYSAAYFATVREDSEIFTIEKQEKAFSVAEKNIENLGLCEKIHLFQGDGEDCINAIKEQGVGDFDMVFIDAAKSHYKRFLDAATSICATNALIVSDNVLMRARTASDVYDPTGRHVTNIKKMREYLEYITSSPNFSTSIISCGDGLALSVFRGNNE